MPPPLLPHKRAVPMPAKMPQLPPLKKLPHQPLMFKRVMHLKMQQLLLSNRLSKNEENEFTQSERNYGTFRGYSIYLLFTK
jgi:hypothetical protein